MADPISNKGFGDAALAERVIEIYNEDWLLEKKFSDFGKLTDLGMDLGLVVKLKKALDDHGEGIINDTEEAQLVKDGFSRDFLKTLRGDDGARALRSRVHWLADHVEKKWWRWDWGAQHRTYALGRLQGYITWKTAEIIAEETLPILVRILREDPALDVRIAAAEVLSKFGWHNPIGVTSNAVIETYRNGLLPPVVFIKTLARMEGPEIVVPYIFHIFKKLTDENSRSKLAFTLADFKEYAIPWILEGLKDENAETREVSIRALFFMSRHILNSKSKELEKILPPLILALDDPEFGIRYYATTVLSQFEQWAYLALPILQGMMRHDPEETCRNAARDAIKQIESEVL